MFRNLILLLAGMVCAGTVTAQWNRMNSPTSENLENALLLSDSVAVAAGWGGNILRSGDGGQTWEYRGGQTMTRYTAMAHYDSAIMLMSNNGVVAYSSDDGLNWIQYFRNIPYQMRDVVMSSPYDAIAVGESGWIIRTTNVFANGTLTLDTGVTTAHLNAISLLPNGTYLIGGDNGLIFRREISDTIWNLIASPVNWSHTDIFALDSMLVYMVGGEFRNGQYLRHVIKSTDGGKNWNLLNLPAEARQLNEVFFIHPDTGWVIGTGGKIYKTRDGGITWFDQPTGTPNWLNGISALPSGRAVVVGDGGRIYLSLNGGGWPAGITDKDISAKAMFYPNPSQGIIQFDTPQSPEVTDVWGRVVYTASQPAIQHDLSLLPSGSYRIQLLSTPDNRPQALIIIH